MALPLALFFFLAFFLVYSFNMFLTVLLGLVSGGRWRRNIAFPIKQPNKQTNSEILCNLKSNNKDKNRRLRKSEEADFCVILDISKSSCLQIKILKIPEPCYILRTRFYLDLFPKTLFLNEARPHHPSSASMFVIRSSFPAGDIIWWRGNESQEIPNHERR